MNRSYKKFLFSKPLTKYGSSFIRKYVAKNSARSSEFVCEKSDSSEEDGSNISYTEWVDDDAYCSEGTTDSYDLESDTEDVIHNDNAHFSANDETTVAFEDKHSNGADSCESDESKEVFDATVPNDDVFDSFDIGDNDELNSETSMAVGLIFQFYVRHNLTWVALDDLLKLLNSLSQCKLKSIPTTSYLFKKFLPESQQPIYTFTVKSALCIWETKMSYG